MNAVYGLFTDSVMVYSVYTYISSSVSSLSAFLPPAFLNSEATMKMHHSEILLW